MNTEHSCLIFFKNKAFNLHNAKQALEQRGMKVERQDDFLITNWHNGPTLQISYCEGKEVQQVINSLELDTDKKKDLGKFDSVYRIGIQDLYETLDEINTLIEAQFTLQDLTDGVAYNTWNGETIQNDVDEPAPENERERGLKVLSDNQSGAVLTFSIDGPADAVDSQAYTSAVYYASLITLKIITESKLTASCEFSLNSEGNTKAFSIGLGLLVVDKALAEESWEGFFAAVKESIMQVEGMEFVTDASTIESMAYIRNELAHNGTIGFNNGALEWYANPLDPYTMPLFIEIATSHEHDDANQE